ncbi:MAG: ComF family protein [Alphaproteobacteria bacterium]|nr:ComF family protein [Alphaproteobacteria bacterium]
MVKFIQRILAFVFPPACPLCDTPVSIHGELCAECWLSINWIDCPKCTKCGYPFPSDLDLGGAPLCPVCAAGECELDWMRSACVYDDASRSAMLPFKHGGKIRYSQFMSRAMIWAMRDIKLDADIIMPVPLASRRLFHRGYNQATLLARPISRASGIRIDYDSVRRKYRDDMGHKNARERAANIRGVFSVVKPDRIRGRKILLVDDVMTTGATFSELRRVLIRAGATAVYGVTFCRVVRAA